MRILALDCSQIQASVCLIDAGEIIHSREGAVHVSHSEALLPHIDGLLCDSGLSLGQVDAFAVGVGPGSFTGIRIGCSTIKALAQVLSKPIVPFSSLRALSLSGEAAHSRVVMVNAYQGQVFIGRSSSSGWEEDAAEPGAWCETHFSGSQRQSTIEFCGTGAKLYWESIKSAMGEGWAVLCEDLLYVRPDGIARAVSEKESAAVHYSRLGANYLRPSQAEIKLATALAK